MKILKYTHVVFCYAVEKKFYREKVQSPVYVVGPILLILSKIFHSLETESLPLLLAGFISKFGRRSYTTDATYMRMSAV